MRNSNLLLAMMLFLIAVGGQLMAQEDNPRYNKELATSLGADDYGMKTYVLVILKTGKNQTASKAETDSLFRGHLDNIRRLARAGKLVVAGPFQKNDQSFRGIFILDVKAPDEASRLLETDPAIKAELLQPELFQWYGSAALPEYLKVHELIEKKRW